MLTSISGKTVLVTGATKGIGRGIAKVFASKGANVLVVGRSEADAASLVDELRSMGAQAEYALEDVGDWDGVQRSVARGVELYGGINILCCNAGIFPQTKIAEMDPTEWDDVMRVNLKSSYMYVKACIPYFEAKSGGRVILTSSITGAVTGYPGWSHYGASKSGQLGFLKTASMELSKYGATVNAVLPGNILTDGVKELGEAYIAEMAASVPLGRLGTPEDIGNAALFLASDEASYITGQTLIVDGGQILPESQDAIQSI